MAKSMLLAVILSIFLDGIGLMYAGKMALGLIIFIVCLICALTSFLIIPGIIGIVLWIVNLVLTIQTVNKANGN